MNDLRVRDANQQLLNDRFYYTYKNVIVENVIYSFFHSKYSCLISVAVCPYSKYNRKNMNIFIYSQSYRIDKIVGLDVVSSFTTRVHTLHIVDKILTRSIRLEYRY